MIDINELRDRNAIPAQMNLILQAGATWKDLAAWMRAYMISTFEGLNDQETIRERLSKIPMELGNVLGIYFGDQISNTYTDLFSNYITSVEALIEAQRNDDDAAVNGYMEQIHGNIHQRTAMLSEMNPYWQESEWRALFFRFLILTIDEANAFLAGDYIKSTETYEALLSHASEMGNYFLNGLYQSAAIPQMPMQ